MEAKVESDDGGGALSSAVGTGAGGREIGARRRVETETKPEERGFGSDSTTGGFVGEGVVPSGSISEPVGGSIGEDSP